MAAPMRHTSQSEEKVNFPLKSGASLVKTKPLFSADNKSLFVSSGSAIKVYSTDTGECVSQLYGHNDYVTGLVLHPKNKLQLLSCSLDKTLIVWDYADSVLLRKLSVGSRVHGMYSVEGEHRVYLLMQASQTAYTLVCYSIGKSENDTGQTTLFIHCDADPRKTAVGPKAMFFVTVSARELRVLEANKKQHVNHKIEKGQELTCVVCHPSGNCVATGSNNGMIILWYKFLQPNQAVKSILHWHSLPVRDLCFTAEGSYLLSGGHECVLVKWHVGSKYRDFLPRLGAPINHVVCARDNELYATCHDDNVIQVITSNFYVQQVYQGLTRGHHPSRASNLFPTGLLWDARSGALVLNGKPGHIQFYCVHEDRQLYNLDIVCQNYISAESVDQPLAITEVTNAAFDSTGHWLATVEYWKDELMSVEISLKFWMYSEESRSYVLNTTVVMPHSEAVCALKMRPMSKTVPNQDPMAITTSSDGKFKLWTLADDTDIYRSNNKWTCESVGFYRNLPAGSADFSDDGSLVAVVFGSCITLWNPENNQLKETLVNTVFQDTVRHVLFGKQGCSQYLVSTTNTVMTVWSLISCSIVWSVDTQVRCICQDPLSDVIAVFTRNRDLFVFRPSDPTPVFSHAGVSDSPVASAAFIPHSKKSIYEKTILSWQSQSELFFMNTHQELMTVSLTNITRSSKTADEVVSFEQNLPKSALSQLMSHHRNRTGSKVNIGDVTRQPESKFFTELFSSACHVQPSVTSLCRPFIQSLLVPSSGSNRENTNDSDDDDGDDSEDEKTRLYPSQIVSKDSGLDSDMEVDISLNQSAEESEFYEEMKTKSNAPKVLESTQIIKDKLKFISGVQSEDSIDEDDLKLIFENDLSWLPNKKS